MIVRCKNCLSTMDATAPYCSICKSANKSKHPIVKKFERYEFEDTDDFDYEVIGGGVIVGNHEDARFEVLLTTAIVVLSLFEIHPYLSPFGLLVLLARPKKKWFRADLYNKVWESNDDEYWKEVKDFLEPAD